MFPINADDMFIAQNIPEFRVIVFSSEFWDRNVPCAPHHNY